MNFQYAELERRLTEAVRAGVEGRRIGVAFSGGLDSGLVAAIARDHAEHVHLYTCGTENAFDVNMARDLSARLDLPWTHVKLTKGNIEARIRELADAGRTADPFTISYELQLFCVCRDAEEDVILTGQGADEFFMGCAKYVGRPDDEYRILADAGVERLVNVSVPCERNVAAHFGKSLVYPYMDEAVTEEAGRIGLDEMRPDDMDSRKTVLRTIARHLGHDCIAERRKKSSQYGSGTTDLIRAMARARGMMYNEYIAYVIDGEAALGRGSFVNARIDPIVKARAEAILREAGLTPSEAVDMLYRRIIDDGDARVLRK